MAPTSAPRRSRKRTTLIVVAVVGGLLVAAAAWVGVRGLLVKGELESLLPIAQELRTAAEARDLDRIDVLLEDAASHASTAAGLTSDPVWTAATILPGIGANLGAVQSVSRSLDAIASSGVGDLLDIVREDDASALDPQVLARASGPLAGLSDALTTAADDFSRIDPDALIPPLADGVRSIADLVDGAAPTVRDVSSVAQVLPRMLGSEEPRTVLLMMQNPAEPRTGGGITGSFALLGADDGSLQLLSQADSGQFPARDTAIMDLSAADLELYGDVAAQYVQNTSMPADFDTTARLASAWWEEFSGSRPDAVISIDPFVLAAVLQATGPLDLGDGWSLGADAVARTLLVDSYLALDRDEQTAFYQAITSATVARLLAGGVDPLSLIEALGPVVEQGSISLWSSRDDEQRELATGPLAGPAARQQGAGDDAYALHLNDSTGGKMGAYLEVQLGTAVAECRLDGLRDVIVTAVLHNVAPADAGTTFPWWVTGAGLQGTAPGHIGLQVSVAGPHGSFSSGVTVDDATVLSIDVEDEGFPTSAASVDIAPGASTTVAFRFIAPEDAGVTPFVLSAPLANAPTAIEVSGSCGG